MARDMDPHPPSTRRAKRRLPDRRFHQSALKEAFLAGLLAPQAKLSDELSTDEMTDLFDSWFMLMSTPWHLTVSFEVDDEDAVDGPTRYDTITTGFHDIQEARNAFDRASNEDNFQSGKLELNPRRF